MKKFICIILSVVFLMGFSNNSNHYTTNDETINAYQNSNLYNEYM